MSKRLRDIYADYADPQQQPPVAKKPSVALGYQYQQPAYSQQSVYSQQPAPFDPSQPYNPAQAYVSGPAAEAPYNPYPQQYQAQYPPAAQTNYAHLPPSAYSPYAPPALYPPPHQPYYPAPFDPYALAAKSSVPPGGKGQRCRHFARGFCKLGKDCTFAHSGTEGDMNRCRHYATKGFCQMGDKCGFSHAGTPGDISVQEFIAAGGNAKLPTNTPFGAAPYRLHAAASPYGASYANYRPAYPPDPYNLTSQFSPGTHSTKVCRHFARGHCNMADKCIFAHRRDGVTTAPTNACRHFARGHCNLGERCGFAHVSAVPGADVEAASVASVPKPVAAPVHNAAGPATEPAAQTAQTEQPVASTPAATSS